MKTIDEIHRANMALLVKEHGVAGMAEKLGKSNSQVSQWLNGSKNSGTGKPRGMSSGSCRTIEATFGKLEGWMDADHVEGEDQDDGQDQGGQDDAESNVAFGPAIRGQVPLISWVTAGAFCESPENFAPGDAEKWFSCPVPHGQYTYCLRVVGRSMDNGDDGYRDGEIIFVDPDAEAMPGRDAIIRAPNGESTFKRLKQDVDGIYLQALNPRWEPNYFKIPEGSHICGIVIFAGRER